MYLPASEMEGRIEKHNYSGQAWQFRRMWKTYRPGKGRTYKALDSLPVESEEDFWNVMRTNYAQRLPPPTSFAGIFHRCCYLPWPNVSVVAPFREFQSGAWSWAIERGKFQERVYQYDINSAYQWAGCQGLPKLSSAQRVFDIETPNSLFVVEFSEGTKPPWFVGKTGMLSSEEVQALGIKPRLLFGVHFKKWLDLSGVFNEIRKRFPFCYKRIGRSYWGRWNGEHAVQQHGWKKGHSVRLLENPLHNPIWAHFITSRIKLRMSQAIKTVGAFHVQVDAVLCRDRLPESTEVGGWKLVQDFPGGVWVHGTGVWGTGKLLVKRMGITEREAEQWLLKKT